MNTSYKDLLTNPELIKDKTQYIFTQPIDLVISGENLRNLIYVGREFSPEVTTLSNSKPAKSLTLAELTGVVESVEQMVKDREKLTKDILDLKEKYPQQFESLPQNIKDYFYEQLRISIP